MEAVRVSSPPTPPPPPPPTNQPTNHPTHPPSQEAEGKTGKGCALDCGAGIGRITKRLLLPLFDTVDMVDVTREFLDEAKKYLGADGKRVDNYFCQGLQDFVPGTGRYDVIWIQWVIGKFL